MSVNTQSPNGPIHVYTPHSTIVNYCAEGVGPLFRCAMAFQGLYTQLRSLFGCRRALGGWPMGLVLRRSPSAEWVYGIPEFPISTLTLAHHFRTKKTHCERRKRTFPIWSDCERSVPFSGRGNFLLSSDVKEGQYAGRWILVDFRSSSMPACPLSMEMFAG